MALNYERIMAYRPADVTVSYGPRDCIIYALGIGIGMDPMDRAQLRFVYEKDLTAFPTLMAVLGRLGRSLSGPEFGVDPRMMVAASLKVVLHEPVATEGKLVSRPRVWHVAVAGAFGVLLLAPVLGPPLVGLLREPQSPAPLAGPHSNSVAPPLQALVVSRSSAMVMTVGSAVRGKNWPLTLIELPAAAAGGAAMLGRVKLGVDSPTSRRWLAWALSFAVWSRCSGVSASRVHRTAFLATELKPSAGSRPQATLSWLPRTMAAGWRARTRSMTALGSAP